MLHTARRHRWVSGATLVLVLAIAGVGGWALAQDGTASAATVTKLVTVTKGNIADSTSASATIDYATTEDLSFDVSGTVTKVVVASGDKVTKGEVLATIDSQSLASTVAQSKATVESDVAKVDEDTDDSASSEQLAADEATLASDRTQLATDETDLSDAELISPIAGTVASVDLTVGEQLGSSSGGSGAGGVSATTSSSATEIEVVSTALVADASVDDTEVGSIAKGQTVTLTTSSGTGRYTGTVASVASSATTSSDVSTYAVVIDLTGSTTGLYDGSTVEATVVAKEVTGVLEIPTAAINAGPTGSTVVVRSNGKDTTKTVTTGLAANGETEVLTGLSAGEQVVETSVVFKGGAPSTRTGTTGTTSGFGGGFGGSTGTTGTTGTTGGFGGGTPPNFGSTQ